MSRLLIINGDDLGYSATRDKVMIGLPTISSVSMLVTGVECPRCVENLRISSTKNHISLGLHLNLTEGEPVDQRTLHTNLVDPLTKRFRGKLGLRLVQSSLQFAEIKNEIFSQIEKFVKICKANRILNSCTGLPLNLPTHVDGHQHCHVIESIRLPFATALKEWGITFTRLPLEPISFKNWTGPMQSIEFLKSVIKDATEARGVFQQHGLRTTDAFLGLGMTANMTLERVCDALLAVPSSYEEDDTMLSCEFMMHPGRVLAKDHPQNAQAGFAPLFQADEFSYSQDRENEYLLLRDERFIKFLDSEGFRLGTFCDLAFQPATPHANPIKRALLSPTKPKYRVCILASATMGTGNFTTAKRLRSFFLGGDSVMNDATTAATWSTFIWNVNNSDAEDLQRVLSVLKPDVVLGVHAYRAGRLLLESDIPFVMVLSGTDVNEMIQEPEKRNVILRTLKNAKHVVSFNAEMAQKAKEFLASENTQHLTIEIVPQSVALPKLDDLFSFKAICSSALDRFDPARPVMLLPLSIRAVKDPLFLIDAVIRSLPDLNLIIAGPILDEELGSTLKGKCQHNVFYCGLLPHDVLVTAMAHADFVLNTSISEGMSNALMEAMALGKPLVVARNIPGNQSLIQHEYNGLLFDTPEDFVIQIKRAIGDKALKAKLVESGYELMSTGRFSLAQERTVYRTMMLDAVKRR